MRRPSFVVPKCVLELSYALVAVVIGTPLRLIRLSKLVVEVIHKMSDWDETIQKFVGTLRMLSAVSLIDVFAWKKSFQFYW